LKAEIKGRHKPGAKCSRSKGRTVVRNRPRSELDSAGINRDIGELPLFDNVVAELLENEVFSGLELKDEAS